MTYNNFAEKDVVYIEVSNKKDCNSYIVTKINDKRRLKWAFHLYLTDLHGTHSSTHHTYYKYICMSFKVLEGRFYSRDCVGYQLCIVPAEIYSRTSRMLVIHTKPRCILSIYYQKAALR